MNHTIVKIDKYWRAANYITVANMYLTGNRYLTRTLESRDIRKYPSGHWGTCPGVNFIYAHINGYIKRHRRQVQLIVGPGHGGNAVMANLQLEKALTGLNAVVELPIGKGVSVKRSAADIRTETNPFFPGTIYDGGELGYSLAVAFGSVLDTPNALCVCIVGDGEAETGALSASWACKDYLDRSSGFVLPILHLNGFRMGASSWLSRKSDQELQSLFSGLGYRPLVVEADHAAMFRALDRAEQLFQEIEQGRHNDWPMLIFRSPKGWTAPDLGEFHIENTLSAHKNPLTAPRSERSGNYLVHWLNSYRPGELFNESGDPVGDVQEMIPEAPDRLGNTLSRYGRVRMDLPDAAAFCLRGAAGGPRFRNVSVLESYLSEVMRRNPRSFRIVSPDELQSNLLGSLKTTPIADSAQPGVDNGRVMEILNEQICQAWMQGYLLTGRSCLMISYEAFMPIVSSMVSQYAKWLFQGEMAPWRGKPASMTYLLTSLCWSNTYSHQNPEFINSLLGHQHTFVRVYLPVDANTLLACMQLSLSSQGLINAIVSTKQAMPQWLDLQTAQAGAQSGVIHWDRLEEERGAPDVVLCAAGEYPVRECMEAIAFLRERIPCVRIRFLTIVELTSIGPESIYPHAMERKRFRRLFCESVPILFCFHGYPSAVKMLLHERVEHERLTVLGYRNRSILSVNDLKKLIMNECSRYHIMLEIVRLLALGSRIPGERYTALADEITLGMEREFFQEDD